MGTPIVKNASDTGVTVDATPRIFGSVEINSGTVLLWNVFIMAVRSDGATKTWTGEALLRKIGSTLTNLETIPVGLNQFASAGDETALTGISVALFSDNTFMGVTCTGQAGQTINWQIELTARGFSVV